MASLKGLVYYLIFFIARVSVVDINFVVSIGVSDGIVQCLG